MRTIHLAGPWLLLVLVAVSAVAQTPEAGTPDWRGTGVIVALLPPPSDLHATRPVIILRHDPIPGLMNEAMTMPFLAASSALFRGHQAGDRVTFGLKEVPDALLVISIEPAPPAR